MATTPKLCFFDEAKAVTIQCDASSTELGAALLQQGQPVAYASRTLSPEELNYAQIEKELLAAVFAMEKFDQYVYGRQVTVESDHKPLQTITAKPLLTAPKRLQRMLLRLQRYDYSVIYKPGKEMVLADTLSRAVLNRQLSTPLHGPTPDNKDIIDVAKIQTSFERELELVNMIDDVPLPGHQLTRLRAATSTDVVLQE